ncbi:cytochrome c biogenesis protein ResB [Ammonifex degensii]|uniref:cytochrome c biogenesis protein ResB n=1 Tax=Ammonifex degensii TaxID=42838 RepID=UPI0002E66504|nr:cytochrome c biogenesis protein ResB [Ammonifex degensii]
MKKILKRLREHFTSLPHVLLVLGLIAVASALGTVIPQERPIWFYLERYGDLWGNLLLRLEINNLFKSWWYVLAEIWLLISLILCTYDRARLAWRRPSWWGLTLTHAGLILILVSLLVTPYVTRKTTVEAVPGQMVNLSSQHFPFDLKVEDFRIEYYSDGTPKQYRTKVSVWEKGKKVREATIAVNHPLSFQGVKVYQMDYGWLLKGRIIVGDKTTPFTVESGPEHPLALGSFHQLVAEYYPNLQGQPQVFYAFYFQGNPLKMGLLPLGKEGELPGAKIVFDRAEQYTGLEVKKNPALPFTFAGFILASLGVLIHVLWHPRRIKPGTDEKGGD